MLIALGILVGWFVSGLFAVLLAGVIDRIDLNFVHGSAPINGLFYFGPIGLIVCVFMLLITLGELSYDKLQKGLFSKKLNIVNKIYDLGYNREKK